MAGNISLGDGGATRTIYVNTGTLNITGVIEDGSATPVLHKTGGGYLRLYAANTFTGGIVLDGGTNGGVWLDNDAALGTGTLTINSSSSGGHIINSSGRKVANDIVLNADFSVVNSDIELQGAVSLGTAAGTARKISLNAGTFSMNGVISDGTTAKAIEKIGNGGMQLGGSNTFTGGVTLSAGRLYVNHNSALGTGTFAISNGTITATGKTLTNAMVWNGNFSLKDTYTTEFSGAVSLGDAAGTERTISSDTYSTNIFSGVISDGATGNSIKIAGGGSLIFAGNNTYTGTTTISGCATMLYIGAGGASGTLGSGNVINNASLHFNRTGTLAVTNDISGSGSVTKNGTGTVVLQGNSSYTGTTTINAGSLLIDGTHADAGAYSVASGGTLGGNGSLTTWDNAVTVSAGGHLAPGSEATTGTLTLDLGTANLNISAAVGGGNATNALVFRLDQTITPSDRVVLSSVSSYLVIGSGILNFDDFAFSLATPFSAGNYTFTLFQTENAISGTLGSNLTGLIAGHNATLSMSGDSKSLLLDMDVIPEPGMAGLVFFALAIGTATQMFKRRRSDS